MIYAVLSNPSCPECGQTTIPFPIPTEEYGHVLEVLAPLGIGDALQRDCRVDELTGEYPVLRCLEGKIINLDELDFLAKRLDSFSESEKAQFQGMAGKGRYTDMTDLINLTYSCQQATVITDFSNLEFVGRQHYMNVNGGCANVEELEALDGAETAILLISENEGFVTPYGVVYDNGMKLERIYDGKHLPAYHYNADMLTVGLVSRHEPEETPNIIWICLPCPQSQIDRAIVRSGIAKEDILFRYGDSAFPEEVNAVLDINQESVYGLNALAEAVSKLSQADRRKFGAAMTLADPEYASQMRRLAENLHLFEFAPGVHTPEEYGRYMIQSSGHFEYDHNLDEFYDYEKYGLQRIKQEFGQFTDHGYISYHGTILLDELMMEDPTEQYQKVQELQIGGMA